MPARFTIQMLSDPPGSECKRGVFRAFPHRCTRTAGTAPPADTRACTDEQTVDKSMRAWPQSQVVVITGPRASDS